MITLAKLAARLKARRRPRGRELPGLIFMTDRARPTDPLAIAARLPRGAAIVLRDADDRRELARRLSAVCRRRGLILLIAGDARLARAVGAGGIHLSEAATWRGPRSWEQWRTRTWIVTAAAHTSMALHRARRAGADAALLSPVFPTQSHPGAVPLGSLRFTAWTRRSPLPVYALGGVNVFTAGRLIASRAVGIAGIDGFVSGR